jgi:hypothetical protein
VPEEGEVQPASLLIESNKRPEVRISKNRYFALFQYYPAFYYFCKQLHGSPEGSGE